MTNYEPDTPRAALAVGALFLAGLTFAALVAIPAAFDARTDAPLLLAAARREAPAAPVQVAVVRAPNAPTEVDIFPSQVEVVATRSATREPALAWASFGALELATSLPGIAPPTPTTMNVSWALPDGNRGAPCRPQV